eukprot:scaffold600234_cov17-Prasinocladus_malaysianus.AAC.1
MTPFACVVAVGAALQLTHVPESHRFSIFWYQFSIYTPLSKICSYGAAIPIPTVIGRWGADDDAVVLKL